MDGHLEENIVTEHRGFPNPATDTNIVPLDLNTLLIKHPLSTFFMRITSNSWERYGIFNGDLALVDKALNPRDNDLVVWWDESSFIISRFHKLPLDTPVWGVVTTIIHRFQS